MWHTQPLSNACSPRRGSDKQPLIAGQTSNGDTPPSHADCHLDLLVVLGGAPGHVPDESLTPFYLTFMADIATTLEFPQASITYSLGTMHVMSTACATAIRACWQCRHTVIGRQDRECHRSKPVPIRVLHPNGEACSGDTCWCGT